MARAKQRTPQLREHVVEVAVDALEDHGVGGFTTRRVAQLAQTSVPAIYELFGDKPGLVREVFFAGFRLLGEELTATTETADPRRDLVAVIDTIRSFTRDNAVLAEVMFSRPFADFDPAPVERQAGDTVRELITGRVQRCIAAGELTGDPTDVAHVILALTLGLAAAERAARLGTSSTSVDRRWRLGVDAILGGLRPPT